MRKAIFVILATVVLLGGVLSGGQTSPATASEPKTLEFESMVGLPPAYTGSQNPIRGINGGGLPWTLTAANGELKASGLLEIDVQGLVFAAGPNVGKNTVPNFRAIVSCLKSDGSVENVTSAPFPATLGAAAEGGGNASIETMLPLPQPCIAPLIFVTSPTGAWFATTGK
jgi:hypothetical protein